jgi:hypothetical protein
VPGGGSRDGRGLAGPRHRPRHSSSDQRQRPGVRARRGAHVRCGQHGAPHPVLWHCQCSGIRALLTVADIGSLPSSATALPAHVVHRTRQLFASTDGSAVCMRVYYLHDLHVALRSSANTGMRSGCLQ